MLKFSVKDFCGGIVATWRGLISTLEAAHHAFSFHGQAFYTVLA